MKNKKTHLGRNISRIRVLQEMKQETVAKEMGVTQQAISKIEQSSMINEQTLQRLAKVLNVKISDIKEFKQEEMIKNIDPSYSQDNCDLKCIIQLLWKLIDATDDKQNLSESVSISRTKLIELLKIMN